MAIRTAQKLLAELKPKDGDLRALILENMALIASKNKAHVERAIGALMEVTNTEVMFALMYITNTRGETGLELWDRELVT